MYRKYPIRAVPILLVVLTIQPVGAVTAESAGELRDSLGDMTAIAKDAGYHPTWTHSGALAQGASERIDIDFPVATSNRLGAMCDYSCKNLDLKLYDRSDNLVASDVTPGEVAGISVTTTSPSHYNLEVVMSGCNGSTCGYVVALYTK